MKLSNSRAMRDAESKAIHVLGIPSTLLMTNAATALSKAAAGFLGQRKRAVVFCGSGNNGGDGVCAAALLLRQGCGVSCFFIGSREKMTPDCFEMERRFIELGGCIETFDSHSQRQRTIVFEAEVIIDAIFGIGLNAPLKGSAKAAVELINSSPAPVVAADIASGVEADTGRILGAAVRADLTVTFSMPKAGHFVEPGCVCCGGLEIADIGIPEDILIEISSTLSVLTAQEVYLPPKPAVSHKGDFGKLFIIGGSVGFSGAPALCAEAAARSGAGMVSLGVPNEIYPLTASRLWEVMCFPLADDGSGRLSALSLPLIFDKLTSGTACVLGCGLSRSAELSETVRKLVSESEKQLIIDADGLFALGDDPTTIKQAKLPPVLTPHEGEFVRLGGVFTGDRVSDALKFSKSRNCVLVLKGHRVICAFPDGEAVVIPAGNPGMAKGGSGDVLAGIIGGLICQLPLKQAVTTACMIHAMAGDLCAGQLGEYSMLPRDIITALAPVMSAITKRK